LGVLKHIAGEINEVAEAIGPEKDVVFLRPDSIAFENIHGIGKHFVSMGHAVIF
jgi:hypothetical protein